MKLNPTVKDFLGNNQEKTILSLAWSLYWRLAVILGAVFFVAGLLISL